VISAPAGGAAGCPRQRGWRGRGKIRREVREVEQKTLREESGSKGGREAKGEGLWSACLRGGRVQTERNRGGGKRAVPQLKGGDRCGRAACPSLTIPGSGAYHCEERA